MTEIFYVWEKRASGNTVLPVSCAHFGVCLAESLVEMKNSSEEQEGNKQRQLKEVAGGVDSGDLQNYLLDHS